MRTCVCFAVVMMVLPALAASAAATSSPDPRNYVGADDFASPSMSPNGTRLAIVARGDAKSSGVVILDATSDAFKPIRRADIPGLVNVRSYRWVDDNRLVAVMDGSTFVRYEVPYGGPPMDMPSTGESAYVVDIEQHKITALDTKGLKLGGLSIVAAPWRQPGHVLMLLRAATKDSAGVFEDWNLDNGTVESVCDRLPSWTGVSAGMNNGGMQLFVSGRRSEGESLLTMSCDPVSGHWSTPLVSREEPRFTRDGAGDDELWARVTDLAAAQGNRNLSLVLTSASRTPVGINARDDAEFVALDPALQADAKALTARFPDFGLDWLQLSEDGANVLVFISSAQEPGAFAIWNRTSGHFRKITNVRSDVRTPASMDTLLVNNWATQAGSASLTMPSNPQALVIVPSILEDSVAAGAFRRYDAVAQWFAANDIAVLRIPVSAPGSERTPTGAAWRAELTRRLAAARAWSRTVPQLRAAPLCLYGEGRAGYAVLAAAGADSSFACAIAHDPASQADGRDLISMAASGGFATARVRQDEDWSRTLMSDAGAQPTSWQFSKGQAIRLEASVITRVLPRASGSPGQEQWLPIDGARDSSPLPEKMRRQGASVELDNSPTAQGDMANVTTGLLLANVRFVKKYAKP